jgi:hypothetical protein
MTSKIVIRLWKLIFKFWKCYVTSKKKFNLEIDILIRKIVMWFQKLLFDLKIDIWILKTIAWLQKLLVDIGFNLGAT